MKGISHTEINNIFSLKSGRQSYKALSCTDKMKEETSKKSKQYAKISIHLLILLLSL